LRKIKNSFIKTTNQIYDMVSGCSAEDLQKHWAEVVPFSEEIKKLKKPFDNQPLDHSYNTALNDVLKLLAVKQ